MIVVFGQADYVARLRSYFLILLHNENIKYIVLPLSNEKPDTTLFDFFKVRSYFDGIPRESMVYVAFSVKNHREAESLLYSLSFEKLKFYNASLDNHLKREYFKRVFLLQKKDFYLLDEWPVSHRINNKKIEVYLAKCVVDKPIKNYPNDLSSVIIPIQVGADLTKERIAFVTDNTGDNISSRNRRYSEMTAFYWMWKNSRADYLGICHYRRVWVALDKVVIKLRMTDVEAVLPLPTLAEHSVYEDYLLKHIPAVWRTMMDVLQEQSPEYYEVAKHIFQGKIFYASNMCILHRDVLNDLCKWMFPIVMEIENRVGDLADSYYNRYAGFCTERLITLYFLYNKRHWKIAHAEKVFIG